MPADIRRRSTESALFTRRSHLALCVGAIALYKIPRVVIGENVNYPGEIDFLRSRGIDVTVVNDPDLIRMMAQYIRENPSVWNEDIGE